jgi:hypothetical protein
VLNTDPKFNRHLESGGAAAKMARAFDGPPSRRESLSMDICMSGGFPKTEECIGMGCKFVIADQNAVSAEGHFQAYTNSLARAAHALGCEVTVLWNKRFPIGSFPASYSMRAVFSFTEAEAAAPKSFSYGMGHFGFELEGVMHSASVPRRV